jgi:hypothetical protein
LASKSPIGAGLPAGLGPPVKVALARAVAKMPRPGALPGTLSWEPKWDGYRCICIRDNNGATLWSRQSKDLTRYFPDLTAALASAVPPGCVIDGEAVIWTGGRLDFSALQQRLGAGPKTLPGLVRETPASYAAFDVLAVAGHDARELPLSQRRALLEELAAGWEPPLSLSPTTTDPDVAAQWFEEMPPTGIEGLVIKGTDQPYTPGARSRLVEAQKCPRRCLRRRHRIPDPAPGHRRRPAGGRAAADRGPIHDPLNPDRARAGPPAPPRPARASLARRDQRNLAEQIQQRQKPRAPDAGRTARGGNRGRRRLVRHLLPPPTDLPTGQTRTRSRRRRTPPAYQSRINPNVDFDGLCPLGQAEPSTQLKAVPIGVQPVPARQQRLFCRTPHP